MKLMPEELLNKKKRDNLKSLCNRIASDFSFKKVVKWEDVYVREGMTTEYIQQSFTTEQRNKPVIYADLKVYFAELQQRLEDNIAGKALAIVEPALPEVSEVPQTEDLTSANDYGLHPSPHEHCYLFWFQKKAVKELYDGIIVHNKRGQALLASTGTGKTFMAGALVRRLVDKGFHENKTYGHCNYLYVTRATIVEQTKRVFEKFFGLGVKDGVEILNIEQLRSRAGAMWVNEKVIIEGGNEKTVWEWRKGLQPVVVLWDECQALKNDGSTQHQIAAAFNDLPNTWQLFISATPFTRVSEAKCFAVSTRKPISDQLGLGHQSLLSNQTWPTYSHNIASPFAPDEYNEAAVERLTRDLDKFIVRVKGVRSQFEAINSIQMIEFQSKEERQYYDEAWERYLNKKAELEKEELLGGNPNSKFQILVQFLMFRMAAEYCRRYHLAKAMYDSVQGGQAAVCALNFKGTIIAVTKILVNDYGVSRDKISLIWGGGQTALTAKQKAKAAIKQKRAAIEAAGLNADDIMEDLDLDEVEDRIIEELDPSLRLGSQSKEERQKEIDRFQSGRSLFCIYTFRAGGVGLSLHHTDEMTKEKCRRKPSGYVYVEDVPKIPVRQRINFVAPTYSAIELVQGLGRCPRLTSLSPTPQVLIFYKRTIEEGVARIVSTKLRCLSRVVRMKEKWEDCIIGGVSPDAHIDINAVPDDPDNLSAEEPEDKE